MVTRPWDWGVSRHLKCLKAGWAVSSAAVRGIVVEDEVLVSGRVKTTGDGSNTYQRYFVVKPKAKLVITGMRSGRIIYQVVVSTACAASIRPRYLWRVCGVWRSSWKNNSCTSSSVLCVRFTGFP